MQSSSLETGASKQADDFVCAEIHASAAHTAKSAHAFMSHGGGRAGDANHDICLDWFDSSGVSNFGSTAAPAPLKLKRAPACGANYPTHLLVIVHLSCSGDVQVFVACPQLQRSGTVSLRAAMQASTAKSLLRHIQSLSPHIQTLTCGPGASDSALRELDIPELASGTETSVVPA